MYCALYFASCWNLKIARSELRRIEVWLFSAEQVQSTATLTVNLKRRNFAPSILIQLVRIDEPGLLSECPLMNQLPVFLLHTQAYNRTSNCIAAFDVWNEINFKFYTWMAVLVGWITPTDRHLIWRLQHVYIYIKG